MPVYTLGTASAHRAHPHQPFFDQECVRLKRDWRRAGCRLGFSDPQVRGIERRYHAYVRSRKRVWLMSRLEECIALFHSCPRQFWRSFRGPLSKLPLPLQTHEVWQEFMHVFIGGDIALNVAPLVTLSEAAYPHVPTPADTLNDPFTLQEMEAALSSLHTGKSSGFMGYPSELLRFAQRPPDPEHNKYFPPFTCPCLISSGGDHVSYGAYSPSLQCLKSRSCP